jgi:hypothetical protein
MTTTLAIMFMVTSLSLWILASNRSAPKTVVQDVQQEQKQTTQTPAATDTEKAAQTGDTKGEQQDTGKPAATTSEPGTSQEKNSSDTQKKESNQEKPPDSTDSKQ